MGIILNGHRNFSLRKEKNFYAHFFVSGFDSAVLR